MFCQVSLSFKRLKLFTAVVKGQSLRDGSLTLIIPVIPGRSVLKNTSKVSWVFFSGKKDFVISVPLQSVAFESDGSGKLQHQ